MASEIKDKSVAIINASNMGSTGTIMNALAETARSEGMNVITYGPPGFSEKKNVYGHVFFGSIFERRVSDYSNRFTGNDGALNIVATYELIKKIEKLNPDIIHLHNMHGNYLNLKIFFSYLRNKKIRVIWTFHDCWAFTGHCPHFDITGCDKWKTHCCACKVYKEFPPSLFDNSEKMYRRKKNWFLNHKDMIIVTPSSWLKKLVQQSFLREYEVRNINNGIDLNIFRPRKSDFRIRHNISNKFIILAVSFSWNYRKGEDRLTSLAGKLDNRFQIVAVGAGTINSDKIICIPRTNSQEELAEIYSSADVFLNPTREDNFPTVNIEALACGIPVLSYGAGGSAEAFDEKSGMVVNDNNIVDVLNKLYTNNFNKEDCIKRGQVFNKNDKYKEYMDLYKSV